MQARKRQATRTEILINKGNKMIKKMTLATIILAAMCFSASAVDKDSYEYKYKELQAIFNAVVKANSLTNKFVIKNATKEQRKTVDSYLKIRQKFLTQELNKALGKGGNK